MVEKGGISYMEWSGAEDERSGADTERSETSSGRESETDTPPLPGTVQSMSSPWSSTQSEVLPLLHTSSEASLTTHNPTDAEASFSPGEGTSQHSAVPCRSYL